MYKPRGAPLWGERWVRFHFLPVQRRNGENTTTTRQAKASRSNLNISSSTVSFNAPIRLEYDEQTSIVERTHKLTWSDTGLLRYLVQLPKSIDYKKTDSRKSNKISLKRKFPINFASCDLNQIWCRRRKRWYAGDCVCTFLWKCDKGGTGGGYRILSISYHTLRELQSLISRDRRQISRLCRSEVVRTVKLYFSHNHSVGNSKNWRELKKKMKTALAGHLRGLAMSHRALPTMSIFFHTWDESQSGSHRFHSCHRGHYQSQPTILQLNSREHEDNVTHSIIPWMSK